MTLVQVKDHYDAAGNKVHGGWSIQWDAGLIEQFGEQLEVETLESKTGTVTLTTFENGWTLLGAGKDPHTHDGAPWDYYTAEIKRCDSHSFGHDGYPSVCTCKRSLRTDKGKPTSHAKTNCHEIGHIERVRDLAERTLRTY